MTLETMTLGALLGYLAGSAPSPEVINDLRERKPYPYTKLTVDASTERLSPVEEKKIAGNFLYVEDSDTSVDIYVKLNEPENEWLNLSKLQFIWLQVYRFFIKNEAGTGSMDIIIGKGYGFTVSPKQIDVNIAAQDANITVDVAAMAVGTIDVDLVAQTVGNISVDLVAQTIGNINVNLAAQDADIDIDIAAATIMLPVDIQAQYLTLDIDIVAQTVGFISVDLAAQSVGNINIDIAAQTVGDVTIDIEAQSVGVYLQADWSALRATDKDFHISSSGKTWGQYVETTYEVPGDKTLFICGTSYATRADGSGDYDHFLYCVGRLSEMIGITTYIRASIGGLGGAGFSFTKPVVIEGGNTMKLYNFNFANVSCFLHASAWGFEV